MAAVQWNPCHRTFLTFCNICNDARDEKIWEDMTMWPAVNLFDLCAVAVTCTYAHVLFLPQFSQETSELSFTEFSSHLSILFLCSVQDGQAGNNVLRLRLDQSITANTPHYLRMTLGKPKGTVGCTKRLHENVPDSTQSTCDYSLRRCSLPSPLCSTLFRLFLFLLSLVDQLCPWGQGSLGFWYAASKGQFFDKAHSFL